MEPKVDIGCTATDCAYNTKDPKMPHCAAQHIFVHIHTSASKIAECETYTEQEEDIY
jgi:hypothetical protein